MKSKSYKKVLEVLPMKRGETLANVKTKVNLAHVPEEFTANVDADVLFVLVNKLTGDYVGYMKIVYSEKQVKILGDVLTKRTAHLEVSEFSPTIQDKAYISMINNCCSEQAIFGKFANYVQINRESLSDRMDSLFAKSLFMPLRGNEKIFELNVERFLIVCFLLIFIVFL